MKSKIHGRKVPSITLLVSFHNLKELKLQSLEQCRALKVQMITCPSLDVILEVFDSDVKETGWLIQTDLFLPSSACLFSQDLVHSYPYIDQQNMEYGRTISMWFLWTANIFQQINKWNVDEISLTAVFSKPSACSVCELRDSFLAFFSLYQCVLKLKTLYLKLRYCQINSSLYCLKM